MRYINVIVGSILSLCEYYRPSVAFCVATTIYSLNYRPSVVCVATILYSLNYRPSVALCAGVATTLHSLNYRPSVVLCVATTLYSLNYRPSVVCCDYTVQFELCFIWRTFLQEKNNGISSHHKQLGTQNDDLFVDCVCAECKHVCCFLSIK